MDYYLPPTMPIPIDAEEAQRWQHTRMRRRMLDGAWREDLNKRLQDHLGTTRRVAWGAIDMSANPFRVICRELSCLYDQSVRVRHLEESAGGLIGKGGAIEESGLWASMRRFQAWVIGCREYLMRIHVSETGKVRYRPVYPDMVHCTANPDAPDEPVKVCELRLRAKPGGKEGEYIWTWDVLDISDPSNPIYKIIHGDSFYKPRHGNGEWIDLTEHYLGRDMSGYNYPYVTKDFKPILPYQLYHAERLGDRLWDPYEMVETVEGSMQLAVGHSFLFHVIRSASWPQRWICNGRVAGLDVTGGDAARAEIVTDPAAVLMLESVDDMQVMVGQWQAGADAQKLEQTLQSYASRLAQDAGLSPSDVQRMSGNARSGYAIALTNAGKREVQRRFSPQFKWADERLIQKTAIMSNRAAGTSYPEDLGYEVAYAEIPLSSQERESKRKDVLERYREGFISKAQAKSEMEPGLSIKQAAKELRRVQALRDGFNDILGGTSNE